MKKVLKFVALLLVVVAVVGVAALLVFPGRIVKHGIETFGPKLTGAPVTVEAVHLSIRTGTLTIKKLVVGNPPEFNTDSAISLHRVHLVIDPRSLFDDTLVVREVLIERPRITYEMGLTGSNIGKLLDNLDAATAGPEDSAKPTIKPADAKPGKQVVIDHVLVSDASVRLSAKLAGGLAAPIPLPDIELHDVGREKEGGVSIVDATLRVAKAVVGTVTSAVTGTGKLLDKGAVAVGSLAVDGAKAAGDLAVDGAKTVGGAAAAVGGAAADGAKAAGGLAVDGVKSVGQGVTGVVGGIAELVTGDEDKQPDEAAPDAGVNP
jgi:uncharacterized protein involved in outer membrane biogenesis